MAGIFEKEDDTMITANVSKEVRKAVYRRDHYRCVICDGDEGLQIHHAVPRGKGGDQLQAQPGHPLLAVPRHDSRH